MVEQRKAQLDLASKTYARSRQLLTGNAVSQQIVDDSEAAEQSARATLASAQASLAASDAAINAAKAQIVDAEAAVDAAQADIESIETDIADATLKSPATAVCNIASPSPARCFPPAGGFSTSSISVTST